MSSLFSLAGKVALLTGSAQGIGLTIATGLGQHGAKVVINGRDAAKCEQVAAGLRSEQHTDAVAVAFDVSDTEAVKHGVAAIEADWDALVAVNQKAVFVVAQQVALHMKERQRGRIINICSMQGELGRDNTTPYAATKGAVKMLTKGMCAELARYNIQVNGIGPGYFDTEITQALVHNEAFTSWLCKRTPAARWGKPEELIGAAVFLASAASNFVNGHILYVDGGMLAAV